MQSQIQILTDQLSVERERETEGQAPASDEPTTGAPSYGSGGQRRAIRRRDESAAVPILLRAVLRLELGLELGLAGVERVEHGGADERADCPGGGLRQALPVHPAAAITRHRPSLYLPPRSLGISSLSSVLPSRCLLPPLSPTNKLRARCVCVLLPAKREGKAWGGAASK